MKAVFKKSLKLISSMRFAVVLLIVLALACALSSLVTQEQSYSWYASVYGERTAALILALGADDAFHSWWFVLITAFLCVNLLMCNIIRLPQVIRRVRSERDITKALAGRGDVIAEGVKDPEAMFGKLRMGKPEKGLSDLGRPALFSSKNRIGLWGAWVCHVGILLLMLGFGLGQMTRKQYTVYGVPGQTKPLGNTGYTITVDDFIVDLHDDDTVEQYTTAFTLTGAEGDLSASVSVNAPMTLHGMKFFQNSTGWAAKLTVYKDHEFLQESVLCAGEYAAVSDKPGLVIYLNALYPDYVMVPGVGPSTASTRLDNPAYLYSVYFQNQMIGMNALMDGEVITIDEYTVTFTEPQQYTLLQVKEDHFTPLALAGGILIMIGLFLAFYLLPCKTWAIQGEDGLWEVHGTCRKSGKLFFERFISAADEHGKGG